MKSQNVSSMAATLDAVDLSALMTPEVTTGKSSSHVSTSKSTVSSSLIDNQKKESTLGQRYVALETILYSNYGRNDIISKAPDPKHKEMLFHFIETETTNPFTKHYIEKWLQKFETYEEKHKNVSSPFTRSQARQLPASPSAIHKKRNQSTSLRLLKTMYVITHIVKMRMIWTSIKRGRNVQRFLLQRLQ